jgi:hypothetical protein
VALRAVDVLMDAGVAHAKVGDALFTMSEVLLDRVRAASVYVSTTGCVPPVGLASVTLAIPFTTEADPTATPSTLKAAVPPEKGFPSVPVTTAVNVSLCPNVMGLADS